MSGTFNVREVDLGKLNSITKYPSIPTYHEMGERGVLRETPLALSGPLVGTEKVDGTNARIVLLPDGTYVLGSREELLYARGDLIGNPALGIVAALRDLAERLVSEVAIGDTITAFYLEVYGGAIGGNAKQYSGSRLVGYRLFDILRLERYAELLDLRQEQLAAWREAGGQSFLPVSELAEWAARLELPQVPPVWQGDALPRGLAETHAFLQGVLERSLCTLDDGAGGRPEGIVVRSADRSAIAKLRFEDYERTMRRLR